MKTTHLLSFFLRLLTALIIFPILFLLLSNTWILFSASPFIYENLQSLPENNVGLVLGTNPKLKGGADNLYFVSRMEAAYELYKHQKVRSLILSGNGENRYYNETEDMRKALVERGVPDSVLILDPNGFRTYESILRSKHIFKQQKITIISQEFHNYRAIFIARHLGIDAVAFSGKDPSFFKAMVHGREWLARVKAILDLYLGGFKSPEGKEWMEIIL